MQIVQEPVGVKKKKIPWKSFSNFCSWGFNWDYTCLCIRVLPQGFNWDYTFVY